MVDAVRLKARLAVALAGRYTISREIGQGGMAAVYLAHDVRHERAVAVKVLRPELSADLGSPRFLREIKLAAGLAHPHILPVHDSGQVDDLLFYVMPYVSGESLRHRLNRQGPLSVVDAVTICREVADALDYAHAQGVVHRDIKPENILLEAGHAVVADFGIARAISAAGGTRMTAVGIAIGTPDYMSPEQASGEHEVDGRSDVYSLGCVLYEMLAGRPPFAAATAMEIMSAHRTSPVPPLDRAGVPPAVATALARALAKRPADRYPNAAAFARGLESTGSGAAGPRWVGALRRHRWAAAMAAVALTAAGVAVLPRVGGARLDQSLYAIVPFGVRGGAPPDLLDGAHCESILYDALGRWEDIRVVSDLRIHDRLLRKGPDRLTLSAAVAVARDVGAGRLVWGEVSTIGDSVQVRAVLYDVRRGGRAVREHSVRIGRNLTDIGARLTELADSLLVGRVRAPDAVAGVIGTRVLAAWQAYEAGHAARARWNLADAARAFRVAVEIDPAYPHANLWLAEMLGWLGEPAGTWRAYAMAASRSAATLGGRDRTLAVALAHVAEQRYASACEEYRQLLARDAADVEAWFGLGQCQARDGLVVPDSASPSGRRFRSSYHGAALAYGRALDIVPSVHHAFVGAAFERLSRLFYTEPSMYRPGYALEPDTQRYAAWAGLVADTLAFVPYRFEDVMAGRAGTVPPTAAAAVARNREAVRDLALRWVRAFPESPDAQETLGRALEVAGELGGTGGGETSAPAAVRRARALARDPAQQLRLAATETRLLVKRERFGDARRLADSLLRESPAPDPAAAARLAPLAALVGRPHRAAQLLRRSAPIDTSVNAVGEPVSVPLVVREAALALLAYAAFGRPPDSLRALSRLVEQRLASWVGAEQRDEVREALVHEPMELAFDELAPVAHPLPARPGAYRLAIHQQLARGDTAGARRDLAAIAALRAHLLPGDVAIEGTLMEARLLVALGDTAAAERLLDYSLDALPRLRVGLLDRVPEAAALVQAMALRAELAAAGGDPAGAARWASAVVALWGDADPVLAPITQRMRSLGRRGGER